MFAGLCGIRPVEPTSVIAEEEEEEEEEEEGGRRRGARTALGSEVGGGGGIRLAGSADATSSGLAGPCRRPALAGEARVRPGRET